jgi:hypothetical protein
VGGNKRSGESDLHIIENVPLTSERYANEIFDIHICTYSGADGPDFILMDDNACAHRAHITNRYLEEATIVRMDLPARSPNFFTPCPTNNSRGIGPYSSLQGSSAAWDGGARP